jgi:hypothetical protein
MQTLVQKQTKPKILYKNDGNWPKNISVFEKSKTAPYDASYDSFGAKA